MRWSRSFISHTSTESLTFLFRRILSRKAFPSRSMSLRGTSCVRSDLLRSFKRLCSFPAAELAPFPSKVTSMLWETLANFISTLWFSRIILNSFSLSCTAYLNTSASTMNTSPLGRAPVETAALCSEEIWWLRDGFDPLGAEVWGEDGRACSGPSPDPNLPRSPAEFGRMSVEYLEMSPEETGEAERGVASVWVCRIRSCSKWTFTALSFRNEPLTRTWSLRRSFTSKSCDRRSSRTFESSRKTSRCTVASTGKSIWEEKGHWKNMYKWEHPLHQACAIMHK